MVRHTTRARCIATVQRLIEIPIPLQPLCFVLNQAENITSYSVENKMALGE